MPFKKGQSGNPGGKPNAAKQRLQNTYVRALASDFQAHGEQVIRRVREENPVVYFKCLVSLLPKDGSLDRNERPSLLPLSATDAWFNGFLAEPQAKREAKTPPDEADKSASEVTLD